MIQSEWAARLICMIIAHESNARIMQSDLRLTDVQLGQEIM